jgi:hypothetical protein
MFYIADGSNSYNTMVYLNKAKLIGYFSCHCEFIIRHTIKYSFLEHIHCRVTDKALTKPESVKILEIIISGVLL